MINYLMELRKNTKDKAITNYNSAVKWMINKMYDKKIKKINIFKNNWMGEVFFNKLKEIWYIYDNFNL